MTVSIDVRDLVRQPGASRSIQVDEPVEGLATELARVPEGREIHAELLLESVVEGILVTGIVGGTMVLWCARCLKPIETAFDLHIRELFAPGSRVEDDEYPLEEGSLDLEPMIRDAVLLSMPFAPLCRPECLGLCPRCGGDINEGECSCPPPVDERWAPLFGLMPEGGMERDRGRLG